MRVSIAIMLMMLYMVCIYLDNTCINQGLIQGDQASVLQRLVAPDEMATWVSQVPIIGAIFTFSSALIGFIWNVLMMNFSFFNLNEWTLMLRYLAIAVSWGMIISLMTILRGVHSS